MKTLSKSILIILCITLLSSTQLYGQESVSRFAHSLPANETFNDCLAISPDGTKIVYNVATTGANKLYLRKIDQLNAIPIAHTEGAGSAFFSPDSKELCFFADDKLKKVLIDGGAAQTICDYSSWEWGGTWGDDGTIIFACEGLGLFRVSASGGSPEVILAPDSAKNIYNYGGPVMLPGSKALLYNAFEGVGSAEANIAVLNLETGGSETLIRGGENSLYLTTGHILFARSGAYWAVPFDAKRLKTTGTEVAVSEGDKKGIAGATFIGVSTNGTLVYTFDRVWGAERSLVLVDRQGVETPFTDIKAVYDLPRFSPDGRQVAVGIYESKTDNTDIWIHNVARGTQIPLTSEGFWNGDHGWYPDGKKVFFSSDRSGVLNIYWKRADGIGEAQPVLANEKRRWDGSWSADGTLFAFTEDYDIWVYRAKDSRATPFVATAKAEISPVISADGKWIAYNSNKTGQWQIYIKSYPGPEAELPVSTQGGFHPWWAPDGKELFYRNGDKMMAVAVETQPSLKLGLPQLLFEKPYLISDGSAPGYHIHPDGQRFLMIKNADSKTNQINIVLNWFEVLKGKMAVVQE